MSKKGPFMEFLHIDGIESAVNTYTEHKFITPTSRTEKSAMLIHMIEFHMKTPDAQDNEAVYTNGQIMDEPLGAMDNIHNPHVLLKVLEEASFPQQAEAAGAPPALFEYRPVIYSRGQYLLYFDPPLLYAKQYIYAATESDNSLNPCDFAGRIGYTLEKVSSEDFIAALTK